jgi:hypothetical protein
MKCILAIDPGASGGFAWNDITGTRVNCLPMPDTDPERVALIRMAAHINEPIVVIEQVWGHIGTAQTGASMFSFGENYGFLQGVILTIGLPLVFVTPRTWQKSLNLGKKKDFNYETTFVRGKKKGQVKIANSWKDHLMCKAFELYPKVTGINEKTADALLILHYGLKNL